MSRLMCPFRKQYPPPNEATTRRMAHVVRRIKPGDSYPMRTTSFVTPSSATPASSTMPPTLFPRSSPMPSTIEIAT